MAELSLLLLTVFWGTTFTVVKEALTIASPGVFLSARFAVAAAALGAVALWRRDRVGEGFAKHSLLLGLFMLLGFLLQTLGLRHTTPARSGFLTGLAVLVVPFIAKFALRRKVKAASWLGVALAVAGLVLLTRPFAGDIDATVRLGDVLTAGCAIAFALQIVYTSEWAPRHPLAPFVLVQVGITLLGVAAFAGLEERSLDAERLPAFAAAVAFTGVLMTAVAFFVMNWGQRHTTAIRAALIFALEPVAAALFSLWVYGERLGPWDWAGGGLIVLAVIAGEVGGALEGRGAAVEPA